MKHNWEYKRLGEVCESISGLWIGKKPPFIKIGIIRNTNFTKQCTLNPKDILYSDVEVKAFEKRKLKKGDIIIEKSGGSEKQPVGRAVLFNLDGDFSFSNFTATLRLTNKSLISSFLHKALSSLYFMGTTRKMQSRTTGLYNLNWKAFLELDIPIPPLSVQEQIVAELDKINEVIDDCKKLLSSLDSLAQSLFYDTFGDPVTNPKGWEIKTLKEVCILKSGDSSANRLPDGNIPYVKVGDMNLTENRRGIITSSNFVDIGNKTNLLFPIGTTIFPKRGGAILTNKKRLTKVQICCDLNVMGAIPKDIHPIYLYFFFLEKDFSELVDGSTVPQINNTDIYPLKILVPPLPLQEQFAKRIEAIEEQKMAVENIIATLKTLLDSRMDYWFN